MADTALKPNPRSDEGIANAKLAALRAKTDHDLSILVERELERGMALANMAATKGSPLHAKVEKLYESLIPLASKIAVLRSSDRARIEGKLRDLRAQLDLVPA